MKNYLGIQQRHLIPTYPNRGITITHGKGVFLYDQSGKKYLDLMSNIGVNILGHSNQFINKKLKSQLERLVNLHCSFNNDIRSETLLKLLRFLPSHLTRVYFCSTGTETIEAAIKFATLYSKRFNFIAAEGGYHGKTLGSLALTSSNKQKYQKPFRKLLNKSQFVKYGEIKELQKSLDKTIAAVILEPTQGEGGIILPPKNYLKKVETLCRKNKSLLIIDEIQTGMGRTGTFFAFEQEKIKPDIICLAKGLGGGIPIGITVTTERVARKIPKGVHTSTFGGNPFSCMGCLATLEYFEKNKILKHVNRVGNYFIKRLTNLKSPLIKEARGRGLMIGLELKTKATPILKKLQEEGVIAAPSTENVIRFLPPLIIEKKEIDFAISKLQKALR